MATEKLKEGTRDVCQYCEQPIVYQNYEFWGDTNEIVPEGPKSPRYIPWGGEETEKDKAEKQAFENWLKAKEERKVGDYRGNSYRWRGSAWAHFDGWPILKAEQLYYECGRSNDRRQSAKPISWCMKMTNQEGVCGRKAKEVYTDRHGHLLAMCGIHLAHARRQDREYEEMSERMELDEWKSEAVEEQIRDLAKYGIIAEKEWVRHGTGISGGYTGKVVLDGAKLLELLEANIEIFGSEPDKEGEDAQSDS